MYTFVTHSQLGAVQDYLMCVYGGGGGGIEMGHLKFCSVSVQSKLTFTSCMRSFDHIYIGVHKNDKIFAEELVTAASPRQFQILLCFLSPSFSSCPPHSSCSTLTDDIKRCPHSGLGSSMFFQDQPDRKLQQQHVQQHAEWLLQWQLQQILKQWYSGFVHWGPAWSASEGPCVFLPDECGPPIPLRCVRKCSV